MNDRPTIYKSLETVFGEHFRVVAADEAAALQSRFATALTPVFVSHDDSVLIAQNQLPPLKSLAIDVMSALYTDTNHFVVKYIGVTEFPRAYAGDGIGTPLWFKLKTLDEAREAALFARQHGEGEIIAQRKWLETGKTATENLSLATNF